MIKKKGSQWCVYDSTGQKELGCHPTEEEAKAQLAAIEANKHDHSYALALAQAQGIWNKVKGDPHPHAACVAMFRGKMADPHGFCAEAEKMAAGTTPAERAAKARGHSYAQRIDGIEIFATGKHNGDTYTEADLDAMVAAFGELDFKPPIKSGHAKDVPGMPALGWIDNLRKQGGKLVADFVDMPDLVYNAIKDKLYNTVSSEIYWDFERAGKTFTRALKAVALLGADIPAVAGLKPLHEMFDEDVEVKYGEVPAVYSQQFKETDMDPDEIKNLVKETITAALAELKPATPAPAAPITSDEKAQRIAELTAAHDKAEKARKEAADALAKAQADAESSGTRIKALEEESRKARIEKIVESCRIPGLRSFVRQYADLATRETDVHVYDAAGNKKPAVTELEQFVSYINANAQRMLTIVSNEDTTRKGEVEPSDEVDRRTKQYMTQHPGVSHRDALYAVLDADPVLKADYAQAG